MDLIFVRGAFQERDRTGLLADITPARLHGGKVFAELEDCPVKTLSLIPESVDLREYNLLTKVKDQKECGSCWAQTAAAMVENLILLNAKC